MERQVILASASPRRKELLHQVGIDPVIVPSQVEEMVASAEPEKVVMELSAQKAEDVAARYRGKDVAVIGADTVVSIDGQILGKPRDREDAERMLTMLAGRCHQVYTGVTLIFGKTGQTVTFADETDVYVYPMTKIQIERYIDSGEPMDKAGAYGIQGRFAAYIQSIRGDYYNVVGLPVGKVCRELSKAGY